MLIVIVFLLLRGSVSVLPHALALSIGPNVYDSKIKHDYRIPLGMSGTVRAAILAVPVWYREL